MRAVPEKTERPSHSVLNGLDSAQNLIVGAIIPNYSQSHIVTIDSLLPLATHCPGSGTFETTLARIGRFATGTYISPDLRILPNKAGVLLYLAKAIPDDTPLPQGYSWQSPMGEFDRNLSDKQSIIAFGTTLLELA